MSPEAGSLSTSRRTGRRARGRRGSGLIETLIALEVMTLAMIGILQLFSLSILVNGVAAARTVMMFKAQQVVENMRIAMATGAVAKAGGFAVPPQQIGVADGIMCTRGTVFSVAARWPRPERGNVRAALLDLARLHLGRLGRIAAELLGPPGSRRGRHDQRPVPRDHHRRGNGQPVDHHGDPLPEITSATNSRFSRSGCSDRKRIDCRPAR
jgi:hypothetical protein